MIDQKAIAGAQNPKPRVVVVVEHGSVARVVCSDPAVAACIEVVVLDCDHEGRSRDELVACQIGNEKLLASKEHADIEAKPVFIEGDSLDSQGTTDEIAMLCYGCNQVVSRGELVWLERNIHNGTFHREGNNTYASMVPPKKSGGAYPFHATCSEKVMLGR